MFKRMESLKSEIIYFCITLVWAAHTCLLWHIAKPQFTHHSEAISAWNEVVKACCTSWPTWKPDFPQHRNHGKQRGGEQVSIKNPQVPTYSLLPAWIKERGWCTSTYVTPASEHLGHSENLCDLNFQIDGFVPALHKTLFFFEREDRELHYLCFWLISVLATCISSCFFRR